MFQGITQDHEIEVFKAAPTGLSDAYGLYCHTCRQHIGTISHLSLLKDRMIEAVGGKYNELIDAHLEAVDAVVREELRGWLWYDFWGDK